MFLALAMDADLFGKLPEAHDQLYQPGGARGRCRAWLPTQVGVGKVEQ
jgi:hypothetical protein